MGFVGEGVPANRLEARGCRGQVRFYIAYV
jgi:hypothetical protein